MIVWNKKVEKCIDCDYWGYTKLEDPNEYRCSITCRILYNIHEINEECPFNKILSVEDIEDLGFVFEEQVVGNIRFASKTVNYLELIKSYENIKILNNGRVVFEGIINNKEELKFILNSIM